MLAAQHSTACWTCSIRSERGTGLGKEKPGIFYKKSRSFLHFHEDPSGMYADLSVGADLERYPINTSKECEVLLSAIDRALDG
jgi:hypothetical protein